MYIYIYIYIYIRGRSYFGMENEGMLMMLLRGGGEREDSLHWWPRMTVKMKNEIDMGKKRKQKEIFMNIFEISLSL